MNTNCFLYFYLFSFSKIRYYNKNIRDINTVPFLNPREEGPIVWYLFSRKSCTIRDFTLKQKGKSSTLYFYKFSLREL